MKILDGKKTSDKIAKYLKSKTDKLQYRPKLVMIRAGGDPASEIYMSNKSKFAEKCGVESRKIVLPRDVSEEGLLALIGKYNQDPKTNGIMVQLPLPAHLNTQKVLDAIASEKDVDCLSEQNLGKLLLNKQDIISCTPLGITLLLESIYDSLEGLNVVIVGRSNIVGKPLAMHLINEGSTVTICNSKTRDIKNHTRHADVVVLATGQSKFFNYKNLELSDNATIVDVGINRDENGKVTGDFDIESLPFQYNGYVTPVPGGVGLLTVASLMMNVVRLAKLQQTTTKMTLVELADLWKNNKLSEEEFIKAAKSIEVWVPKQLENELDETIQISLDGNSWQEVDEFFGEDFESYDAFYEAFNHARMQ